MSDAATYDKAIEGLEDFGRALERALAAALENTDAVVNAIPWRVKSRESAARKLLTRGKSDADYLALHDLLGVRVITYFESDLDSVANVISELLDLNTEETSDKRDRHKPDQFGYRSRHFVGSLSSSRLKMPEYQRFAGKTVEIQVRSLLQHAWAEIEHDLGYKPSRPLGDALRRDFSRLAALMELADDGFSRLRTSVESALSAAGSLSEQSQIGVSVGELAAFIKSSDALRTLDRTLAEVMKRSLLPPGKNYLEFLAYLVDLCGAQSWTTTEQIADVLGRSQGNALIWGQNLSENERLAIESVGHGLRPGFGLIVAAKYARVKRDN